MDELIIPQFPLLVIAYGLIGDEVAIVDGG